MHPQTATPSVRAARLHEAGRRAREAYEAFVAALVTGADRDARREAEIAFNRAQRALDDLAWRRGYEQGDHVRLSSARAPWNGQTGILGQGIPGDDRYPFSLIFDQPQPSEHGKDGLAERCYTDLDGIEDIEP